MTNQLHCEKCGGPAMVSVLADPFGKADLKRNFCAVHTPEQFGWGGVEALARQRNEAVAESERLRAALRKAWDDLNELRRDIEDDLIGVTAAEKRAFDALEGVRAQDQPSALETAASETQALDAAKWRTLMSLPRIRVVGGAGFSRDDPDHYAFLTVELWTKHDAPTTPESRHMFDKFMAIAEKARGASENTSEDLPSQAAVIHDNGDAYK